VKFKIKNYVYAVARIRVKELSLFNKQDFNQILSYNNYQDCIKFLVNKNWEYKDFNDYEYILEKELENTWNFIFELVKNKSLFSVFLCQNDFFNLKACIKSVISDSNIKDIFLTQSLVDYKEIFSNIKKNNFKELPDFMKNAAEEAFEVLLHTGNGQLCDVILDKYCLETVKKFAESSENDLIKKYAELLVSFCNIKIAVRANKTGKSLSFLNKSLVACKNLNISKLAIKSCKNLDEIYNYLLFTEYKDCVNLLKKSDFLFEKWFDEKILQESDKFKFDSFSLSAIINYILYKINEVKNLKIIISGKFNKISDEIIVKRLRRFYA